MKSDARVTRQPEISRLIAERRIAMEFQPVVDLDSGGIVGYEALARAPLGTSLDPPELIAAARAEGLGGRLDQVCREVALAEAVAAGLGKDDLVFLNVEPSTLDAARLLDRATERRLDEVSVVVELTERMLTARPAEVLAAVTWLRERGCRVALDDVGTDPRSLALMPFVSPDLIKLDLDLVQGRLEPLVAARVLNAIGAESERSGAVLVAEGVETVDHLERARSMGATLGQGWLLGRPGPLDPPLGRGAAVEVPRARAEHLGGSTPFGRLSSRRPPKLGGFELILALSRQLEDEVESLGDEAVLVSNFQERRFLTDDTLARYERLAQSAALVAAIGPGIDRRPGIGVRGADIATDRDLRGEWDVTVVGPHFAAAFAARELPPDRTGERQFEFLLSYDRDVAIDAARLLLARVLRDG